MPLESCGVSCGGTDRHSLCIIGYGNRERRDDGLGSYVVGSLAKRLGPRERIKLLVLRQLDVDVVEDLRHTELVLFVDASVEPLHGGWQWRELKPDIRGIHFTSHHVGPSALLGLTLLLYGRCPDGWQLAIQGERFAFGETLSGKARKRAETLIAELARWIVNGQRCWQLEGWDIPVAAYVGH